MVGENHPKSSILIGKIPLFSPSIVGVFPLFFGNTLILIGWNQWSLFHGENFMAFPPTTYPSKLYPHYRSYGFTGLIYISQNYNFKTLRALRRHGIAMENMQGPLVGESDSCALRKHWKNYTQKVLRGLNSPWFSYIVGGMVINLVMGAYIYTPEN